MLSMGCNTLDFPKIVRIGEVTIRGKEVDHYKLDWTDSETAKERKHEKWRLQCWPDLHIPFVPSLPEEYKDWCDRLEFALSRNYLREIRRMAQMAKSEWAMERSFDTSVRDTCLDPAINFVWCSFYLLGDCVYDRDTKYYSRLGEAEIARYVLPYRFWCHQTGRGLTGDHARMGKLQDVLNTDDGRKDFQEAGAKWVEAAKAHRKRLDKAYEKMYLVGSQELKGKKRVWGSKWKRQGENISS